MSKISGAKVLIFFSFKQQLTLIYENRRFILVLQKEHTKVL